VAELLPLLPYDTGAMRALAGDLRSQASTLGQIGWEIAGATGSMLFDGPAGDRIRSDLGARGHDTTTAADALQSAAGKLDTTAADVDRQNAAIQSHNQHVLDAMTPIERKLVLENT
jgi:uncharacterized protein YukE